MLPLPMLDTSGRKGNLYPKPDRAVVRLTLCLRHILYLPTFSVMSSALHYISDDVSGPCGSEECSGMGTSKSYKALAAYLVAFVPCTSLCG
jgi:hypothetical protein